MDRDKFLVFDLWGDFAHFKRFYTTSSPLSFSIPPRTSIIGLISAILGIKKDDYLSMMSKKDCSIAIRIINPIKKIRLGQNLVNTKDNFWIPIKKGSHEPRTQIRFEYLKDPKFRIYFSHTNAEIYNRFKTYLKNHLSVYTPYLGISELIADFCFVSEEKIKDKITNKFTFIYTVIPMNELKELDLNQPGKKYFKERLPVEMTPGRIVTEYNSILYEIEGKPINAKVENALILENNDVITIL